MDILHTISATFVGENIRDTFAIGTDTMKTTGIFLAKMDLSEYSQIKQIKEQNSIIIYPNPSNGMLFFNVNGLTENASHNIFDMNGQSVYNDLIIDQSFVNKPIDLSSFPKGVYFF